MSNPSCGSRRVPVGYLATHSGQTLREKGKSAHMHIQDIFRAHQTSFSFEFFPPKTDEAWEELFVNIARLQELQPSLLSVSYGAGGTTRERSHDMIVRCTRESHILTD